MFPEFSYTRLQVNNLQKYTFDLNHVSRWSLALLSLNLPLFLYTNHHTMGDVVDITPAFSTP